MTKEAASFGGAPFKYLGDWTDLIAKGELPKSKPPRPQGVERNIVVTTWEWGTEKTYMHDLISSDRRNPTVNAFGRLFGSPEYSSDNMPILDPKTSTVSFFKMLVRIPTCRNCPDSATAFEASNPRPIGATRRSGTRANNHNPMFDKKGRVWFAATGAEWTIRRSARRAPTILWPRSSRSKSARQIAMFDPKTMKYTLIDTCFGTHHLQFG